MIEPHRSTLARFAVVRFHLLLAMLLLALPLPAAAQPGTTPADWNAGLARDLLAFGEGIGREGLDPGDYRLEALRAAIGNGSPDALELAATHSFALIARDLSDGHVPYSARRNWHILYQPLTPEATARLVDEAIRTRDIAGKLQGLAPAHEGYRALKAALAATPAQDGPRIATLKANLERWRWLPRDFSQRYLLVNVPAYEVRLIDGGRTVEAHRVIVGKPATPTPQLRATVRAVMFNPPWLVPNSIVAESIGALIRTRPAVARARGYDWTRDPDGSLRVRQLPGENNALGQVKLVMPNAHAIYLHDTPSKRLFDNAKRAYSHGCVRVQDPLRLAETLLGGTGWTMDRIDTLIAGDETTEVPLARPVPVFIVYLTAVAGPDGQVTLLEDLYGWDKAIVAALNGSRPLAAGAGPLLN